jgi:exonuclease SbcC
LKEQKELQTLQDEKKSLVSRKQEIEAKYDVNKHNAIKENIENLRIEQAKTSDHIKYLKITIKTHESKLKEVGLGIKAKEDARKKALSLKTELKMIDLLRSGLRDVVQPAVRRNSVSRVSEEFQGFYQALSNDNIDYAAIDEDGNVDVTRNGESSPINSLSGGETTCAALALRLAICSSLTKNQLLLLDEPTIHLDEMYRSKLRDFLGTHDFDQLVVVTHDNTFDSLPAQIYNVTKRKGESVVTALRTGGED